MIIKFLKDYEHTIKNFKKDAVVKVMPGFGQKLIKKKVAIEVSEDDFEEVNIIKKIMEEKDG